MKYQSNACSLLWFCAGYCVLLHKLQVFKPGKPLKFSCTFDAKPKPETDDAPAEDATLADSG